MLTRARSRFRSHDLAGYAARPLIAEQIDLDASLALRVAEDVAAGQNQRLTLPTVDHRARAPGDAGTVFDPQAGSGLQQLPLQAIAADRLRYRGLDRDRDRD
jgi:hypothetical protein